MPTPASVGLKRPVFEFITPIPSRRPPIGENWMVVSPAEIQISKLLSNEIIGNGLINKFMVSVVKQFPAPML